MTGIRFCGTAAILPPLTVDNGEYAKIVDTSDEWIRPRTGIVTRHIANGETTWRMGARGGQGRDRRRGHRPRGDRAGAGHDGHRRFRDPLDELLHPAGDRREKRDVHRRQLRLRGVRLRGGHGSGGILGHRATASTRCSS